MSNWVYVTGIVRADTLARTNAEAVYIGQTTIDHLPRIWGSEGDAKLHVHLEDGHNSWSTCDEYRQSSNLGTGTYGGFECQSNILITISGQLRDASFDKAFRQTVAALCRLSKSVEVEECAVLVRESFSGKTATITNGNGWMYDLCEGFWVKHPDERGASDSAEE